MALFDSITGSASKRAAKANAYAIDQGLGLGADALTRGYGAAATLLGAGGADNSALKELQGGYAAAYGGVGDQYGKTQGYLGQAGDLYRPMAEGGGRAFNGYLDATGANGAEGSERAQANFRAGPGYQYAQDQALGAVQRTAAARGGLAGGNATADIMKMASGLADQSWNGYVSGLGGASALYQPGIAGQAAGLNAQASASQNYGTQLGALGTGLGQAAAGIYGTAANNQTMMGQNVAGLQTGAADAYVKNNNTLAKAQTEASQNLLGGILGGAQSVFGAAGKAGGLTNLFSNVFK